MCSLTTEMHDLACKRAQCADKVQSLTRKQVADDPRANIQFEEENEDNAYDGLLNRTIELRSED